MNQKYIQLVVGQALLYLQNFVLKYLKISLY